MAPINNEFLVIARRTKRSAISAEGSRYLDSVQLRWPELNFHSSYGAQAACSRSCGPLSARTSSFTNPNWPADLREG
jgi:hypothetical protein